MNTLNQLYEIQKLLFALNKDELIFISGLYKTRYDFEDKNLQTEIAIIKLKQLFMQFRKKERKFSKIDSLTLNKFWRKKHKKPIAEIILKNMEQLKHLIDNDPESYSTMLIKIIFIINNDKTTCNNVKTDIDHIKNLNNLVLKSNDIEKIVSMISKKRRYKRPQRKYSNKPEKPIKIGVSLENKIFHEILQKKKEIFPEEKNDDNTKQMVQEYLSAVRNHKSYNKAMSVVRELSQNYKKHVYVYASFKRVECMKKYFDFIFELKSASNGKIDNIIQTAIYVFFDEYHTHFDFIFENELKVEQLPFKYDDCELRYIVESTILDYFIKMKDYKHIHQIIEYFIDYLSDRQYIEKFATHEIRFYFANLKGILRCLNYQNDRQNDILSDMWAINKKIKKKVNSMKLKYKYFHQYEHLIDFKSINFKQISKSDHGKTIMDIYVLADKIKLIKYLKKVYNVHPFSYLKYKRILKRKKIYTMYQYRDSIYFKHLKPQIQVSPKIIQPIPMVSFINFKNLIQIPVEKTNPIEKKTYTQKIDKLQKTIDVNNFKTLFNLPTKNIEDTLDHFNKMVLQLDDNNKNILLSNHLNSSIRIMETKYKNVIDNVEKSKMKREINLMKIKKQNFQSQIRDLDQNGYEYGTNYDNFIPSGVYLTSDIIKQTEKMKATMEMIDKMTDDKQKHEYVNVFLINMISSYESTNTQLYNIYNLFINHKIDTIFENYCREFYKQIKQDLRKINNSKKNIKQNGIQFAQLSMILLFILQNEEFIEKFYKTQTISQNKIFTNKFVKINHNNNIGKVLYEEENVLFVKTDTNIETVDKTLVTIIKSFENKEVIITTKHPHKGRLCRVYKQLGDVLMVTLDGYGKNPNSTTNIKTFRINLSGVKVVYKKKDFSIIVNGEKKTKTYILADTDYNKNTIVKPYKEEIKDLYSISRFLFRHVIQNNKTFNPVLFNKLYKIALHHVNEIILGNNKKIKTLRKMKKQKHPKFTTEKVKAERFGLVDMDISFSMFRLTEKDEFEILNDNSINYLRESEIENKLLKIVKSPAELEEERKQYNQTRLKNISKKSDNFMHFLNQISLQF